MRLLPTAITAILISGCSGPSSTPEPKKPAAPEPARAHPIPAHLAAAVAAPERPAKDRERDADRKPGEVTAFFGIEPGMKVAELMAGRGYYAELLARAVGPEGTVYVHNTPFVLERFAAKPISERLARPGLSHAVRWDRELEALDFPEGQLDVVMLVLFYHDTFWQKIDRARMLAEIDAGLKPGGVFALDKAIRGKTDRFIFKFVKPAR